MSFLIKGKGGDGQYGHLCSVEENSVKLGSGDRSKANWRYADDVIWTEAFWAKPQAKILIVDDRVENLKSLEISLSVMSAQLVRATSGNEALSQRTKPKKLKALLIDRLNLGS